VTDGRPAIYLASPLGFVAYAAEFALRLAALVEAAGFIALDPWDNAEGRRLAELVDADAPLEAIAAANAVVGMVNRQMIERCDGLLACLDGPVVDDGTASEIGYAAGLGRVVTAFRGDRRVTGDNRATVVNLQLEHFVRHSGGEIFTTPEGAVARLATLLGPTA
jgi:nucleoside 2-deoxyribosyltransferase